MTGRKSREIFFETPIGKPRVFQKPRLVMFSGDVEVASWENTQPLYFYPFSWLDYLGRREVREVYIIDPLLDFAEREIRLLESGKVHFESPSVRLINLAKKRGHKTSVICNVEDLVPGQIEYLGISDFVRIRVNKHPASLSVVSCLPREQMLSCIKAYVGEGCDYMDLAIQARDFGFDFFHVAKRLSKDHNLEVSPEEKEEISLLKQLETRRFRVVLPSSLDERFARRFAISSQFGNATSCGFSRYRRVLQGGTVHPCYTAHVLNRSLGEGGSARRPSEDCLDCACIYENDMLEMIEREMRSYKNPRFALEYT